MVVFRDRSVGVFAGVGSGGGGCARFVGRVGALAGNNFTSRVVVDGYNVYAATNNGLAFNYANGNIFTNYQTGSGLGSNTVKGAFVKDGVVYAATGIGTTGGLSIAPGGIMATSPAFTNYTPLNSGLGAAVANGSYVRGNTLYVATTGGVSVATITPAGTVTGSASFTNPSGRAMTYSVTGTSTGGGTVTVDPTTGAFVFTPTLAQRIAALQIGNQQLYGVGPTTDTFVVTASDGAKTATQTVTVEVSSYYD